MYDILPFPNITASDVQGQVEQINNYLIQFKEELEFVLTNLGEDNLAESLVQTINALSESAGKTTDEETLQQVVQSGLRITDVINSNLFKGETIKNVKVNGILLERDADRAVNVPVPTEYIVGGQQTITSTVSGGVNVFTFANANGEIDTFEVRNGEKGEKGDAGAMGADGKTPTITFSVNFNTGNLEYTST